MWPRPLILCPISHDYVFLLYQWPIMLMWSASNPYWLLHLQPSMYIGHCLSQLLPTVSLMWPRPLILICPISHDYVFLLYQWPIMLMWYASNPYSLLHLQPSMYIGHCLTHAVIAHSLDSTVHWESCKIEPQSQCSCIITSGEIGPTVVDSLCNFTNYLLHRPNQTIGSLQTVVQYKIMTQSLINWVSTWFWSTKGQSILCIP